MPLPIGDDRGHLRSCSTVHGGAESKPSESHLRTTGGDTLQAAAA